MIVPVLLAGGIGSRLWPLSRSAFPKQFMALFSSKTMLQESLDRLTGLKVELPLVLCNEEHRFIVAEQLREVDLLNKNIILEPVGRNTAPAIALAAFRAVEQGEDPLLLALAADHMIRDVSSFRTAVETAVKYAESGKLVTFGVVPSAPETGFGYIQRGADLGDVYKIAQFVEKPDFDCAQQYLDSGEFYWNSGMFMFRASKYLAELKAHRSDIYLACEKAISGANSDLEFLRVDQEAFIKCPIESVDYAVMEKTNDAVVVPLDAGWSDVGSWSSLWDVSDKDEHGNVLYGDVMAHNSRDNYVYAEIGLVATVGIENIVVVQTKDAVLVAQKDHVQDVKKIVRKIEAASRSEYKLHREVYRPWGKYDSVDSGNRYQVKRITVKPGEKLSIQMHHHRSEHWVVVSGSANITIDDETNLVTENESVYIPVGAVHSLENPGKVPLELIEVQVGSYLGEDDIVRFEDRYGRT